MKRSRIGRAALATIGAMAVCVAGLTISANGAEAPSYREFKASTFRDVDRQYIVNGDEPAATDGDLRQFYKRMGFTPLVVDDPDPIRYVCRGTG